MQTHHRVLMTFETEESRSSLEMKLYVMPKKTSGFSRAFCFSWLTVYMSVMESTAETKNSTTRSYSCLQSVSLENRQRHRLHLPLFCLTHWWKIEGGNNTIHLFFLLLTNPNRNSELARSHSLLKLTLMDKFQGLPSPVLVNDLDRRHW